MKGFFLNKFLNPVGGRGGDPWSSYWETRNAYFALPATGVSLMVGQEVTIYGDTLINVPIGNPLTVTYTCDIGTQVGNNLVITPVAGDIGSHSLRAVFKNGSYTIEDKTIALTVYDEAPAGAKSIMVIGDSTGVGMMVYGGPEALAAALPDCTFTFLGTEGTTPEEHEAFSGAKTYSFVIDSGTPVCNFTNEGEFDLTNYFTVSGLATPNYVYVRLGLNDLIGLSDPASGGLTTAALATIMGYIKTLVDGFLAFDASLKIILDIPTITENTGTGWAIDYGATEYLQDNFIEIIHQFWDELITTYANGTYDARVDCAYGAIFLNRFLDYPNDGTNNTANSGVHPDASGYAMLGTSMALHINKLLKADLIPTGLTVVWEEDHAKIDFTDATGGAAQHEIWSSKDGAAYVLVTTLAAGTVTYNDATWQNASMNYRVRAKHGTWFSDYSAVVNIVTPLVFKTNQTALTLVSIGYSLTAGSININWGDGSDNDYPGDGATPATHEYAVEANPYYIVISGNINNLRQLNPSTNNWYADITKMKMPTAAWYMVWTAPNVAGLGFTGDSSNLGMPSGQLYFMIAATGVSNRISGDWSSFVIPTGLARIYAANQDLTGLPRGNYKQFDAVVGFDFGGNNCSVDEVSNWLIDVAAYFAGTAPYSTPVTPTIDSKFILNGVGMGIPNAAGLAAKAAIEAAYTAASKTVIITVNS